VGSRTDDTLSEVDQIRGDLEAKLTELGTRLPPMARWGKRAVTGVGGGVVLFVLTRMRVKMKQNAGARKAPAAGGAPITVRGGISTPAALGVAAVWAGVRIFEATQRAQGQARGPAIVREFPAGRRAT